MILLNFSHPLTAAQVAQAEALVGRKVEGVIEARAQFDHRQPFGRRSWRQEMGQDAVVVTWSEGQG